MVDSDEAGTRKSQRRTSMHGVTNRGKQTMLSSQNHLPGSLSTGLVLDWYAVLGYEPKHWKS